jgi:hypothetical protein
MEMSDFDEVLERLVGDPGFASALAADPGRVLAGYRLSDDEVALLRTQLGGDSTDHVVEIRTNQSSAFGLLGSLAGVFRAGLPGIGDQVGSSGLGQAPGPGTTGMGVADATGMVVADATSGMGMNPHATGVYPPPPAPDSYMPPMPGDESGVSGFSGQTADGTDAAAASGADPAGQAGFGAAAAQPPQPAAGVAPPADYHTRVDVDGDGRWDTHIAVGRADGGVEIYVDRDGDGRADFVGHDLNADGLVESADYDKNADGFFEKTMYDDNGDGWLDRTIHHKPPGH